MDKNQIYEVMSEAFEEAGGSYLDLSLMQHLSAKDCGDSEFMAKLCTEFLESDILDFLEEPARSNPNFFYQVLQNYKDWNYLNHLSEDLQKNKDFFLKLIEDFDTLKPLKYASYEVRNHGAIIDSIINRLADEWDCIAYCPPIICSNPDIMEKAVIDRGANIEFATDDLKNDKSLALKAIENDPMSLRFVSEALKGDLDVANYVLSKGTKAAKYLSDKFFNSESFLSTLVQNAESINDDILDLIPIQLKSEKALLTKISKKIKDAPGFSELISKMDDEFFEQMLQVNGNALRYVPDRISDDYYFANLAINNDPQALKYCSERLSNEPNLVKAAVEKWPAMFRQAGNDAKNNKELVAFAVQHQGSAIDWASEELKDDIELAIMAIENDPWALRFVSERLRNDRDLVFKACEKEPTVYAQAGSLMFEDKQFALFIAPLVPNALFHFSDKIANDPDVLAVDYNSKI